MLKTKVVLVACDSLSCTYQGQRKTYIKNKINELSKEEATFLLALRGKGCRCHNKEGSYLFMSYDQWKEWQGL
jgi:hypothetical protein